MSGFVQFAVPENHGSFDWAKDQANPSSAYPATYKYADPWRINKAWLDYVFRVNVFMGTTTGFREALQIWSGWINSAANPEYKAGSYLQYPNPDPYPRVELVLTAANEHFPNPLKVIGERTNAYQFEVFNYLASPPDVNNINPRTHRWMFDEFHSIDRDGKLGLAPKGLRFWIPRIARNGEAWVPKSIVEPTELPKEEVMGLNPDFAVLIDLYEGNGLFSPSKASEKIDGVIAQATRGLYQDRRFLANHDISRAAGIPFMAYNQYVAQLNGVRLDPIRQADLLLTRCLGLQISAKWWAYDSAGLNVGKLNASTAKDTLAGLKHLKNSGGFVGVYGNASDIAQLYRDAPETKNFPLWIARYSLNQDQWYNTTNIMPHMLLPYIDFLVGLPWLMWQYASERNWLGFNTGPNYGLESASVDINVWQGTVEQMRATLNITDPLPPTEPLPGDEMNLSVKVLANPYLNIRQEPTTSSAILGNYPINTVVTITDIRRVDRDLWGRSDKGWIALRYLGAALTDLCT